MCSVVVHCNVGCLFTCVCYYFESKCVCVVALKATVCVCVLLLIKACVCVLNIVEKILHVVREWT